MLFQNTTDAEDAEKIIAKVERIDHVRDMMRRYEAAEKAIMHGNYDVNNASGKLFKDDKLRAEIYTLFKEHYKEWCAEIERKMRQIK